mgnify:CR=1 FL=1
MVKVAIVEDNKFLAQALVNKVGMFDQFRIKFQATDGEEILSFLDSDSMVDVILMDIQMPNMDGIEATKIINRKYPHIKIIMLTIFDNEQHIYESLRAGAVGYLMKESTPDEIKESIHESLNGGAPMSPEIARKAINIIRNPEVIEKEGKDFGLSNRETEVLKRLTKGLNYNEIASNMVISPNTVRKHIENLYGKLNVHNKAEAILIAYNYNLV